MLVFLKLIGINSTTKKVVAAILKNFFPDKNIMIVIKFT